MTIGFKDSILGEYAKARKNSSKSSSDVSVTSVKRESSIPTSQMEKMSIEAGVSSRKVPVFEIDPKLCKPWKYHNRDHAWLTKDKCQDLIYSIKSNGQQEPSLLREIHDDNDYKYEIIYGVRRWFACSNINGKKLLAKLTKASDKECMILMHIENADSQDISDFERACSFKEQFDSGLFKTQKEFAEAMGVTPGHLTKLLFAAEIFSYNWLSSLFPNKVDISIRSAYKLSSLIKNPHSLQVVKQRANELKESGVIFSANKLFKEFEELFKDEKDISLQQLIKEVNAISGVDLSVTKNGQLNIKMTAQTNKEKVKKALNQLLEVYLV